MYDLLSPPSIKGLKCALEVFKEQSHEICCAFWKSNSENLLKFQENNPRESAYWKFITMLNMALLLMSFKNFPKIFRTAILKFYAPMDALHVIE